MLSLHLVLRFLPLRIPLFRLFLLLLNVVVFVFFFLVTVFVVILLLFSFLLLRSIGKLLSLVFRIFFFYLGRRLDQSHFNLTFNSWTKYIHIIH